MNLKRFILFQVFIVYLFFAFQAVAFSIEPTDTTSPYLEPTVTVSPHGGYTTTTNKCKYCHAVHRSSGTYVLTRADTRWEVCDYCHGDGAGAGTLIVSNFEGHTTRIDMQFYGRSPSEEDTETFIATKTNPFTCLSCHSVHGATERTVKLADQSKDFLLLNNPDGFGTTLTTENTLSEWCADCHSANLGSNETSRVVNGKVVFSHASSSTSVTTFLISPDDGKNYGPSCRQCHASSLFPHAQGGTGRDLLKDSFDGISLDDVCNDCHSETSLP